MRALEYWASEGNIDEVYEVERTTEFVIKGKRYRIEVLKGYSNPKIPFPVSAYVAEDYVVTPRYEEDRELGRETKSVRQWRQLTLPSVYNDTADDALHRAIGFLLKQT